MLVFAVIIGVINAAPINSDLVGIKLLNETGVDNPQNSYQYQLVIKQSVFV